MFRKATFGNREKNKNNIESLSQALSSRSQTNINTGGGGFSQPYSSQEKEDDVWGGGANAAKGVFKLGKALYDSKYGNTGGTSSGLFSNAANNYISGSGGDSYGMFGNAANSYISGGELGGSSAVGDAIGSEVGSSGGGFGGGGSVPWAMIAKGAKAGYNGIMGKDDSDYSDMEETIVYPLQGAATGSSFGPWGAAGGALYGLGYSFKDDLGLDDNDFLTTMLFPIGMGDEHSGLIQL